MCFSKIDTAAKSLNMVHRFWWTVTRGGYCTHEETFHRADEILWWGKGGVLYGESEKRIAFLRAFLEELPEIGHIVEEQIENPNERKKHQNLIRGILHNETEME